MHRKRPLLTSHSVFRISTFASYPIFESYDSSGGHQDEAVRLRLRLVRDYHGGQRTDVQTEDR